MHCFQVQQLVARLRLQPRLDLGGRCAEVAREQAIAVGEAFRLNLVADYRNAERRLAHRQERDARAGLSSAIEQAGLRQPAQCAVYRDAGATEFLRQFQFAGNCRARLPLTIADPPQDLFLNGLPASQFGRCQIASPSSRTTPR